MLLCNIKPILAQLFAISLFLLLPANALANSSTAYWVWAGILPKDVPENNRLYIYQGAIKQESEKLYFTRKGIYPSPLKAKEVYLAFRLQGELPDPDKIVKITTDFVNQWQQHDVAITGIQLDFDSATAKLLSYSEFLKQYRSQLPKTLKLSITGLGDWVLYGNPKTLKEISETTDEIIFQLYQGRKPLPEIDRYVEGLATLQVPFKVGFLSKYPYQNYIDVLNKNEYFKGIVLFVQK